MGIKKTKEAGRQIFGSGSVGVGLGTLGDHVTFVTVEQKTGGWIEGHPHSILLYLKQLHYYGTSGQLLGQHGTLLNL